MAGYVECPTDYGGGGPSLFLAGGITGCPDWQATMRALLADGPYTLLNPRRAAFPIHDPTAAEAQIAWEHAHLRKADAILFWFAAEQLQPIALYELGAWSMTQKPLFVGVHPDYARRQDVEIQTRLTRPEVIVAHTLESLAQQVK
jgi:hypothetical protein